MKQSWVLLKGSFEHRLSSGVNNKRSSQRKGGLPKGQLWVSGSAIGRRMTFVAVELHLEGLLRTVSSRSINEIMKWLMRTLEIII